MKKLLAILSLVTLVACGGENGASTEVKTDSSAVVVDSTKVEATPAVDSVKAEEAPKAEDVK
jgi:hypothetical protein